MAENSMSLENYANTLVSDIKMAVALDIKQTAKMALIRAINETVYIHKKKYVPTYDFVNAVEISDFKIGNNRATFSVIINASKMQIQIREGQLSAHAGVPNKQGEREDFRELLIPTLNDGSSGSPIYNFKGYHFFEKAEDDMDRNLILVMAKALRAKGWKVSIH